MYYFAYGSNMDIDRMKERNITYSNRVKGVLNDYNLVFNKIASRNKNEGYANITEEKNKKVEGVLYNLEEKELEKLDRYEGHPHHYYREAVMVCVKDELVEAITYIAAKSKTRNRLKPTRKYLEHLIKGSDVLSDNYRNTLKSIETLD